MSNEIKTQVVILGAGPGGYSAAFRAADLGLDVVLVESRKTLGGVCLNVGCIPSKALLHVAKVIDDAKEMASHGVTFGAPEIDLDKVRSWKDSVIAQLTGGLTGMAKQRKVTTVSGYGKFTGSNTIAVEGADGTTTITFDNAIIAAGSSVVLGQYRHPPCASPVQPHPLLSPARSAARSSGTGRRQPDDHPREPRQCQAAPVGRKDPPAFVLFAGPRALRLSDFISQRKRPRMSSGAFLVSKP